MTHFLWHDAGQQDALAALAQHFPVDHAVEVGDRLLVTHGMVGVRERYVIGSQAGW